MTGHAREARTDGDRGVARGLPCDRIAAQFQQQQKVEQQAAVTPPEAQPAPEPAPEPQPEVECRAGLRREHDRGTVIRYWRERLRMGRLLGLQLLDPRPQFRVFLLQLGDLRQQQANDGLSFRWLAGDDLFRDQRFHAHCSGMKPLSKSRSVFLNNTQGRARLRPLLFRTRNSDHINAAITLFYGLPTATVAAATKTPAPVVSPSTTHVWMSSRMCVA